MAILDANAGRVLSFIGFDDAPAIIRQPVLAAARGLLYLDIDDLDGHLEVLDTSTSKIAARVRISTSAGGELRNIPVAAALSPDGRRLYVANQRVRLSSHEATEVGWVSVVDTQTNEVTHDIALPQPGVEPCYGANPRFVAIGPAGDRLLVVNEYGIASLVDTDSQTVVETVSLGPPTARPRVVAINPLRSTAYIGGEAGLTVVPL